MPTCTRLAAAPLVDPPAVVLSDDGHTRHLITRMTTKTDRRIYNKRIQEDQKTRGFRRVSVTLSATEYEQLAKRASGFDERVTTHLKRCAFAHLEARYLVPPDIDVRLDALMAIMRGIGNNLNQLARHSNEMRYFLDTEEVRLQIRRLDDEVRRFVASPPCSPEKGETP